ncbi:MAG: META domain-containing protein [Thermonemataceae bacterium]|nr:META domain-containing protein [Thermonemataceae bacterium]
MKPRIFFVGLLLLASLIACQKVTKNKLMMDIEDKKWLLVALPLQNIIPDTATQSKNLHFVLHKKDKKITAFTGCNALGGQYTLTKNTISFSRVFKTEMYCEGKMERENEFAKIFGVTVLWEISDKQELIIRNIEGQILAKFIAIPN